MTDTNRAQGVPVYPCIVVANPVEEYEDIPALEPVEFDREGAPPNEAGYEDMPKLEMAELEVVDEVLSQDMAIACYAGMRPRDIHAYEAISGCALVVRCEALGRSSQATHTMHGNTYHSGSHSTLIFPDFEVLIARARRWLGSDGAGGYGVSGVGEMGLVVEESLRRCCVHPSAPPVLACILISSWPSIFASASGEGCAENGDMHISFNGHVRRKQGAGLRGRRAVIPAWTYKAQVGRWYMVARDDKYAAGPQVTEACLRRAWTLAVHTARVSTYTIDNPGVSVRMRAQQRMPCYWLNTEASLESFFSMDPCLTIHLSMQANIYSHTTPKQVMPKEGLQQRCLADTWEPPYTPTLSPHLRTSSPFTLYTQHLTNAQRRLVDGTYTRAVIAPPSHRGPPRKAQKGNTQLTNTGRWHPPRNGWSGGHGCAQHARCSPGFDVIE
ncbi:hypothetical protein BD779DRAFT_1477027 [Infundibulicybe gibba]|nr:hypothetical protein BD779DRAFT_1477027 [Infundibulicybe gibba]